MLWRVDPASRTPLYEQLLATIRSAAASGTISHGERLPAAKELASSLDLNVHTVLRAYQLARDEGLLDLRRGRGAVVVARPKEDRLARLARDVAVEAHRQGISPHDLLDLVRSAHLEATP